METKMNDEIKFFILDSLLLFLSMMMLGCQLWSDAWGYMS